MVQNVSNLMHSSGQLNAFDKVPKEVDLAVYLLLLYRSSQYQQFLRAAFFLKVIDIQRYQISHWLNHIIAACSTVLIYKSFHCFLSSHVWINANRYWEFKWFCKLRGSWRSIFHGSIVSWKIAIYLRLWTGTYSEHIVNHFYFIDPAGFKRNGSLTVRNRWGFNVLFFFKVPSLY